MNPAVVVRATHIWWALVALAVINGAIREFVLTPHVGQKLALPLSGVFLAVLILLVTIIFVPYLGRIDRAQYWYVGGIWVVMTVAFEILVGLLFNGRTWMDLLRAYDMASGNLWVLVLTATLIAPYLAAKVRGLL